MNGTNLLSHFISFAFLMLFMWIGVTYVSQNIQYSCAKQFFNSAIEQMENYNFQQAVLDQCKKNAEQKGYQLTVETFSDATHTDARVILNFEFYYPVIQVSKHYTIEGYAR